MSPFSAAVMRADIFLSVAGKCLGDLVDCCGSGGNCSGSGGNCSGSKGPRSDPTRASAL